MAHIPYLTTYQYDNKIRLGNKGEGLTWGHHTGDGGYVIADVKGYDCYIAAGINDDESFSRDFIKYAGTELPRNYAFDGNINGYPHKFTSEIHFVHKNVSDKETQSTTNLRYITDNYNNIFLKMNVDGKEYIWLNTQTNEDMLRFKQIVVKIYCPTDDSYGVPHATKVECLKKLATNHYLIHVHANNNGTGWGKNREKDGMPTVMELTYIRKDCVAGRLEPNTIAFPIEGLDVKNAPYEDMKIDYPPFVFKTLS